MKRVLYFKVVLVSFPLNRLNLYNTTEVDVNVCYVGYNHIVVANNYACLAQDNM